MVLILIKTFNYKHIPDKITNDTTINNKKINTYRKLLLL